MEQEREKRKRDEAAGREEEEEEEAFAERFPSHIMDRARKTATKKSPTQRDETIVVLNNTTRRFRGDEQLRRANLIKTGG